MRITFRDKQDADYDGHRYVFTLGEPCITADDAAYASAMAPIRAWCEATFGPRHLESRASRWWTGRYHVWFRDSDDALQFRLRWC